MPDNYDLPITSIIGKKLFKRIGSNFGWSIISEVGGKGFLYLATVYLARVLGAANFGLFTFAQTITSYCWLGVDLGVNMYGAREIAKSKVNAPIVINPLLTLRIFSGITLFSVYSLSIYLLFQDDPLKRLIFAGFAFYLLTRSLNLDWVMRGFEKFNFIALGNFSTFLSILFFLFIFVRGESDVARASFIWSFSYLLGDIALLIIYYRIMNLRYQPTFNIKIIWLHLKESIHFTVGNGLLFLYQYLPIIFLGFLVSNHEVGIFSAPYNLVLSLAIVATLLAVALYPILSELFFQQRPQFYRMAKYFKLISCFIGLFLGGGGVLASKWLIPFLYGPSYAGSIAIFQIVIWFAALMTIRVGYSIPIAVAGLQKYYAWASLFGVIFYTMLFLSLIFVCKFDILYSACYGLIITEIGVIIILAIIWRKFIRDTK